MLSCLRLKRIIKNILWQSYYDKIDFKVKYIWINFFLNEINCKQSLISIWKKIFKTVHQLSYFVGHPVCHRIDLFCSYFKTRGATKSHSYTSSVIYTWPSPSIYFAVYDYVPGFWNLKIDLILVSGSMCTFLWSGVLFDNNCAKHAFTSR